MPSARFSHQCTAARVAASALLLAAPLAGCAKQPPASDPDAVAAARAANDPLEPTNRFFYRVNTTVDTYTLKPVAQAYVYAVPTPVRRSVHNTLTNLNEPVTLANAVLEGKPKRAGTTLVRFLVNSTAGVAGLFDVAKLLGYREVDDSGGLTLENWGIPPGPYLFLPVLGPQTATTAVGYGLDIALNPFTYVPRGYGLLTLNDATYAVGAVDARANVLHDLDELNRTALDPYASIRSAYQQNQASRLARLRAETGFTTPDWYTR